MAVVLVNYHRAGDVRLFDWSNGTFQESSNHSWKDAVGQFAEQDGSLICLFCCNGVLYLNLDGNNTIIDDDLTTCLDAQAEDRHFQMFNRAELIYDKTYPRKPDTDGNPFWPSDAEDEDILMWVHNVVASREMQQRLLERLSR